MMDGAVGTELARHGFALRGPRWSAAAVEEAPALLEGIHREYVASDLDAKGVVPFPKNLKLKEGETVIFAAVEFKSESHRNSVMKKVFADPDLMPPKDKPMPFDYKRMVYGGFKILVDL